MPAFKSELAQGRSATERRIRGGAHSFYNFRRNKRFPGGLWYNAKAQAREDTTKAPCIGWICPRTFRSELSGAGLKSSSSRLWPRRRRAGTSSADLPPTRPRALENARAGRSRKRLDRFAAIASPSEENLGMSRVCSYAKAGAMGVATAGFSAGLTGSCKTVALWPATRSVTRTIVPLANSSAS